MSMHKATEKMGITAIILTYNEGLHIKRCVVEAQKHANQVIVVDSFSTDQTVHIATSLGAEVYQNPWVNHAVQFNWALDNVAINNEWVVRIDADEYLECEFDLAQHLAQLPESVSGLNIRRKYLFLGQWMRHGGMYPIETLRIFRTGHARVENRWMDEHIVLQQGTSRSLDVDIVDDNLNSVAWWIDKHNAYATKEMLEALNQQHGFLERAHDEGPSSQGARIKRWIKKNGYNRLPIFLRPLLYFIYRYFLRFGFMDGRKGLAFHFMQGFWYRCLVDLKLLEAQAWIAPVTHNKEQLRETLSNKTGLKL